MISGLSSLPNSHFYDHVVPSTLLQVAYGIILNAEIAAVAYGIILNAEIAAYIDSDLGF